MLNIKNITVKNFMSVGNVTQGVHFDASGLTLVLGNNMDLGGAGSRNGTGKTTIINALSYALYGGALYNIKKDNLVNKTNHKQMFVTVDFEKDGTTYRIERGRKPNIFKFIVNEVDSDDTTTDEMQGEGRLTQLQIEKVLGMSHTMFKHIVALNTYTEPFLSMRAADSRELIEQLLGITQLSDKAEMLKVLVKETKGNIKEEKWQISAIEDSNETIKKSISDLERRRRLWLKKKEDDLSSLAVSIVELERIDVNKELESHDLFTVFNQTRTQITTLNEEIRKIGISNDRENTRLSQAQTDLDTIQNHKCYACGQELHDTNQEELIGTKKDIIEDINNHLQGNVEHLSEYKTALDDLGELGVAPVLFYNTKEEAYNHQAKLNELQTILEHKSIEEDPYQDQIDTLTNTGMRDVSWDEVNRLTELKDHQDFLYKLLTNKDSFIRKRIIEQNLSFMNNRLDYYITRIGLPHEVQFQSDLTVTITQLGQDLDFDNLSRGERNRLILGLSWAFRDVFESMNHPINLLCIDELIDSGMDTVGVENALGILKKLERERDKNIILISHRDELVGRVHNVLQVVKENGFTTFNTDIEVIDA
jgi:DNA repair exonuclease SbcCD ATPase subunit